MSDEFILSNGPSPAYMATRVLGNFSILRSNQSLGKLWRAFPLDRHSTSVEVKELSKISPLSGLTTQSGAS